MTVLAMPIVNNLLSAHFGHAEHFAFVHLNADSQAHVPLLMQPPAHAPGVLPRWLADQGATVVIAGGMGSRAQELLHACGITVMTGVPAISIDDAVAHYLAATLPTGQVACTHDDHHHDCQHG